VFSRFFHEQAAAGMATVALTEVMAGFALDFLGNFF